MLPEQLELLAIRVRLVQRELKETLALPVQMALLDRQEVLELLGEQAPLVHLVQ